MDAQITDFLGTSAGATRVNPRTPAQIFDDMIEVFEKSDDSARAALADLLPVLLRNLGNTKITNAVKALFVPIDRKQAQVLQLPVVKRRAIGKEPRVA